MAARPIQQLVQGIQSKADWQKKIIQTALLEKWCGEALRQGASEDHIRKAFTKLLTQVKDEELLAEEADNDDTLMRDDDEQEVKTKSKAKGSQKGKAKTASKDTAVGIAKLTDEEISRMKVADLKASLLERGLDTTGKKDELIQRLKQANDTEAEVDVVMEDDDSVKAEDEEEEDEQAEEPANKRRRGAAAASNKGKPKKPTKAPTRRSTRGQSPAPTPKKESKPKPKPKGWRDPNEVLEERLSSLDNIIEQSLKINADHLPIEKVVKSDDAVSQELCHELEKYLDILANVPDDEKDWHPGSNQQVLDLIHPSLYCYVKGKSVTQSEMARTWRMFRIGDKVELNGPHLTSAAYATLHRCQVTAVSVTTSAGPIHDPIRINQLNIDHPDTVFTHTSTRSSTCRNMCCRTCIQPEGTPVVTLQALDVWGNPNASQESTHVTTCEDIRPYIEAVNFWNDRWGRPYTSSMYQWLPSDFHIDADGNASLLEGSYINNLWPFTNPELMQLIPRILSCFIPLWEQIPIVPEGKSIRNGTLQVIVKAANIVLTPEHPHYDGGSWHVEGMSHEHIIASGILYYATNNITDSYLEFRKQLTSSAPRLKNGQQLNQHLGQVHTKQGRALVFTNEYQHHVKDFDLIDPTKPGERKILCFFVIDPDHRITSAIDVWPQQREWMIPFLREHILDICGVPSVIADLIMDMIMDGVGMSRAEAMENRRTLMAERSNDVTNQNQRWEQTYKRPATKKRRSDYDGAYGRRRWGNWGYNLCEH